MKEKTIPSMCPKCLPFFIFYNIPRLFKNIDSLEWPLSMTPPNHFSHNWKWEIFIFMWHLPLRASLNFYPFLIIVLNPARTNNTSFDPLKCFPNHPKDPSYESSHTEFFTRVSCLVPLILWTLHKKTVLRAFA